MSFTVTRSALQGELFQGQHTWPLKLTVASTDGCPIPAEIFVYHEGQTNTEGAYSGDIFEAVASVHQLNELGTSPDLQNQETPEGIDPGKRVPYYRRAELIFHCRYAEEAEDLYTCVMEDINDLILNFQALQNLNQVVVTTLL